MLKIRMDNPVFIMPPFDMRPRSLASLLTERIQVELPQFQPNQAIHGMQVEFLPPLSLVLDGHIYPLQNVILMIDIVPRPYVVRALLNACHRLSDNTIIALTGTAEITIKDKQMIIMIIAKKDRNAEGTMSMRAHLYDLAGNKTTLPEGIVMGIAVE